jgi:predicted transcriptional regulator
MCITLYYMSDIVTLRLDPKLTRELDRISRRLGKSRSDFMRESLRRSLERAQFEELRQRVAPFAEAAGYLTDDDVFRDVS